MRTPFVLHITIGSLITMLNKFGVLGWNRWLCAIIQRVPLTWEAGEEEPPLHLEFVNSADLSGRNLDGIDLGLVDCEGVSFEGSSLKGAMLAGIEHACFRDTDICDAVFTGNISGTDFTGAKTDGASFADAYFHADDPPLGLPNDLLATCPSVPIDDEHKDEEVVGLFEYPVTISASLAESAFNI